MILQDSPYEYSKIDDIINNFNLPKMVNIDSIPNEILSIILTPIIDISLDEISLVSKNLNSIINKNKDFIINEFYNKNTVKYEVLYAPFSNIMENEIFSRILKESNTNIANLFPYKHDPFIVYFQGSIVKIRDTFYPIGSFKMVLIHAGLLHTGRMIIYLNGMYQHRSGNIYPHLHSDFFLSYYDSTNDKFIKELIGEEDTIQSVLDEIRNTTGRRYFDIKQRPLIEKIIHPNKKFWPFRRTLQNVSKKSQYFYYKQYEYGIENVGFKVWDNYHKNSCNVIFYNRNGGCKIKYDTYSIIDDNDINVIIAKNCEYINTQLYPFLTIKMGKYYVKYVRSSQPYTDKLINDLPLFLHNPIINGFKQEGTFTIISIHEIINDDKYIYLLNDEKLYLWCKREFILYKGWKIRTRKYYHQVEKIPRNSKITYASYNGPLQRTGGYVLPGLSLVPENNMSHIKYKFTHAKNITILYDDMLNITSISINLERIPVEIIFNSDGSFCQNTDIPRNNWIMDPLARIAKSSYVRNFERVIDNKLIKQIEDDIKNYVV